MTLEHRRLPQQVSKVLLPLVFGLLGCSVGGNRAPGLAAGGLDEGQSLQAIAAEVLLQPALFQRREYNPTETSLSDGGFMAKVIHPAIERNIKNRNFGRWPTTQADAKSFGQRIAANVWSNLLKEDAGRRLVESKMLEYWQYPLVQQLRDGASVEMDLGVAPGKIELDSTNTFTIRSSQFVEEMQLQPAELVRRLKSLQASHPQAKRFRVKVITAPHLRDNHEFIYEYAPGEDLLYVYRSPEVYCSPSPVGGLEKWASGESPLDLKKFTILRKGRIGAPQ